MDNCKIISSVAMSFAVAILLAIMCLPVQAQSMPRVALLPLGDVSYGTKGIDGINLEVTQDLRDVLEGHGFDLVSGADVEQFMIYNRMRFVGYLNEFLTRKIGLELECSYALVGTVTEFKDGEKASFGLTLTLFDTQSGMPVWGGSRGKSIDELVGFLGIGTPDGVKELQARVLTEFVADITGSFGKPSIAVAPKNYDVVDLQLSSSYSRGNGLLNCQLEVNFLDTAPESILLKSGGKEYPLTQGGMNGVYQGVVRAEKENGVYDLSLVFDWGDDRKADVLPGIAAYQVINSAPEFDVRLNEEVVVEDIAIFRNRLVMVPQIEKNHLMDRWSFEVSNDSGKRVLTEEYAGGLPDRLVWEGKDSKGKQFQDGIYVVSLKVWDAVGNRVSKAFPVYLQTEFTPLDMQVYFKNGKKYLEIRPLANISAPVVSWELLATTIHGDRSFQSDGIALPAVIELSDSVATQAAQYDLQARDSLGNRIQLRRTKVEIGMLEDGADEPAFASTHEPAWLDNF